MQSSIEQKVLDLIGLAPTTPLDTSLIPGAFSDHLAMVDVILAIEDEFDVELEDDDLIHAKTIGCWVNLVKVQLGQM